MDGPTNKLPTNQSGRITQINVKPRSIFVFSCEYRLNQIHQVVIKSLKNMPEVGGWVWSQHLYVYNVKLITGLTFPYYRIQKIKGWKINNLLKLFIQSFTTALFRQQRFNVKINITQITWMNENSYYPHTKHLILFHYSFQ